MKKAMVSQTWSTTLEKLSMLRDAPGSESTPSLSVGGGCKWNFGASSQSESATDAAFDRMLPVGRSVSSVPVMITVDSAKNITAQPLAEKGTFADAHLRERELLSRLSVPDTDIEVTLASRSILRPKTASVTFMTTSTLDCGVANVLSPVATTAVESTDPLVCAARASWAAASPTSSESKPVVAVATSASKLRVGISSASQSKLHSLSSSKSVSPLAARAAAKSEPPAPTGAAAASRSYFPPSQGRNSACSESFNSEHQFPGDLLDVEANASDEGESGSAHHTSAACRQCGDTEPSCSKLCSPLQALTTLAGAVISVQACPVLVFCVTV